MNQHLCYNFQGGTLALATENFASAVSEIRPVVVVALAKMSVSFLLEDLYPTAMAEMIQLNPYALKQEHAASNTNFGRALRSHLQKPDLSLCKANYYAVSSPLS